MQYLDQKEAKHLLREVPYEEWLVIGRMMVPKGVHMARISSLEELEWTIRPTAKTLVAMRFDNLEQWLRKSIGDSYLADKIAAVTAQEIPYVEQSKAIYEAVLERVTMLRNAAGNEEADHV